jgi:uncharacterized protein (UPF0261 family)
MQLRILILGTLDTKGDKISYLRDLLQSKGFNVLVMDCGVLGTAYFEADIRREDVARAAHKSIGEVRIIGSEDEAIRIQADGANELLKKMIRSERLDVVVGVGGTMGAALFLRAIKGIPIGVKKYLISTCLCGPFLRSRDLPPDLFIYPLLSDILGLSELVKWALKEAAEMIAVSRLRPKNIKRKGRTIGITTLGTSAFKYTEWLLPALKEKEVNVELFHIGGGQGWAFEELVKDGTIKVALDLCVLDLFLHPNPWVLSVPNRLGAYAEQSIPVILAPGGVNFFGWAGPTEISFNEFGQRKVGRHNELAAEVQRTASEVKETAKIMAERLNKSLGAVTCVIPLGGFSHRDVPGGLFYDPGLRRTFLDQFKSHISDTVKVIETDFHINDEAFSRIIIEEVFRILGY